MPKSLKWTQHKFLQRFSKHNSIYYFTYSPPSDHDISVKLAELQYMIESFSALQQISPPIIDYVKLTECLIRVDQRKLHYKMYHQGLIINETKESAVLAYWILKYKPLSIDLSEYPCGRINEDFCIYLISKTIDAYRRTKGFKYQNLSDQVNFDFLYTITHRVYNYDSLVLYIDTLANINP